MIFNGRPLTEIADSEILSLVTDHVRERQHIEYKITVDLKHDQSKLEILCDIASLANGGGGYLIIGIRDDGTGKAQKFEPTMVGDTERIRQSLRALCIDHIQERIIGLEFDCRDLAANPVLIIRVPQSDRVPHMVTFNHNTHFVTRYEDGKREMSYVEIKREFTGDLLARRLDAIEVGIQNIGDVSIKKSERDRALKAVADGSVVGLLTTKNGVVLSEALNERFKTHAADTPFFRIAAVPEQTSSTLVDLESNQILDLIQNPPKKRHAGWDMNFEHFPYEPSSFGLRRGRDDFRTVEYWRNGYLELRAHVDERFCWGQSDDEYKKQPTLNPVPICEYVVSFLRFYKELLQRVGYVSKSILTIDYLHIKGFRLRSRGIFAETSKPFAEDKIEIPEWELPSEFDPDKVAFRLLKQIFAIFGLSATDIPAWNVEEQLFEFDKLR